MKIGLFSGLSGNHAVGFIFRPSLHATLLLPLRRKTNAPLCKRFEKQACQLSVKLAEVFIYYRGKFDFRQR
jgi:hypothetical protein